MLPHYMSLTKQFPRFQYAVAQVDYMKSEVKGLKYTPTYSFYHKGRKVDEFFGSDRQRLQDHLWLHSSMEP
uniref:Thioredoxin 1 n=1 Tax=Tetraselmis sp. GSL018 TaxID=582737 RepID=A0A061QZI0_9CHLO